METRTRLCADFINHSFHRSDTNAHFVSAARCQEQGPFQQSRDCDLDSKCLSNEGLRAGAQGRLIAVNGL